MLLTLLGLQILIFLLLVIVLLRRPATPAGGERDARWEALLAADLPRQLARADARAETMERLLRAELAQVRQEAAENADRGRAGAEVQNASSRREMLDGLRRIEEALGAGVTALRVDQGTRAEQLRSTLEAQVGALAQRFAAFAVEAHRQHADSRDSLHARLNELGRTESEHQDRLRATVEGRLDKLNQVNAQKLEEMRSTVDEKLHATLQTRLTESFGAVTEQLTRVHTGLGQMSKLSAGVDDLSRLFTNVKSRGGFAEVQLGMLLSQMLAPGQFRQNVKVKPHTAEIVEYAVKLPTPQGELLLPIDAKFPREAWERLETAYAEGSDDLGSAGRAFEAAIRTEARRICEKYIAPPVTTSFAVMFLPTEGLYAEVMRRDGLQAEIQQNCRVTLAGPSTLSAILNSFQMGFHMLELQRKGDEVWKVLAGAKTEFEKFEVLMGSMERQVGTVQNTLEKLNTRTRMINKTLREVSVDEVPATLSNGTSDLGRLIPLLAASDDA